jgi:hypothetical protein
MIFQEDDEEDDRTEDEIEWDRKWNLTFEKTEEIYWPGHGWIIVMTERSNAVGESEPQAVEKPDQVYEAIKSEEQELSMPLEIQVEE